MKRSIIIITAMALAVGTTAVENPSPAQAHAKHFAGNVGLVVGPVVIPYLHRHHIRIGVKRGSSGGPNHFYGHQAGKPGSAPNGGCCYIPWDPFNLRNFSWHGVAELGVRTGITATACTAFGASAAAATPTLFTDVWAAALSAAACENGVYQLHKTYQRYYMQPRG
jgi:hypothetical protein